MPLKSLYEKLSEKAKEKGWNIEDVLTKENLPESVMKFVRLSKVSANNRYEAKIILEFKEENKIVECIYSVWKLKENEKEFKEGANKPEDIIKFVLFQEEEIENYVTNLMEELNKKYLTNYFTRIRSKT